MRAPPRRELRAAGMFTEDGMTAAAVMAEAASGRLVECWDDEWDELALEERGYDMF